MRNGEPFGELALIDSQDKTWIGLDDGRGLKPTDDWAWIGGDNPGPAPKTSLSVPLGSSDASREDGDFVSSYRFPLGLTVLATPASEPDLISSIKNISNSYDIPLLNRIVTRGQLTAAEGAALNSQNQTALAHLITLGLVVQVGAVWVPTDLAWLDLNVAPAPVITNAIPGSNTITTIVQGTGDPTDIVQLYDNGTLIPGATGVVAADGTWSISVLLTTAVQQHKLSATQTVTELPHVGLTSVLPENPQTFQVKVVASIPAAPTITSVSGQSNPVSNQAFKYKNLSQSATVTVDRHRDPGRHHHRLRRHEVARHDHRRRGRHVEHRRHPQQPGRRAAGDGRTGVWPVADDDPHAHREAEPEQRLQPAEQRDDGLAVLAADPPEITSRSFSGNNNNSTTNVVAGTPFTFAGSALPGATVNLYDGTTLIATLMANAVGYWSWTTTFATTGTHSITATATDPLTGYTSAPSDVLSLVVYTPPAAPVITNAVVTNGKVTVTGTGIANDTITLYDNGIAIKTVKVGTGGTWSINNITLAAGSHTLTATQAAVAGQDSPPSAGVMVTV